MPDDTEKITDLAQLPPRKLNAHKGNFGRVLVVGGSRGMIGAVSLAANAALRGGAGLVTFAAPATVQPFIATLCPCATSLPLDCDDKGELVPSALSQLAKASENCDVMAVGPGMSTTPAARNLLAAALDRPRPLVIDADGLNNLATMENWPQRRGQTGQPLILTPHPGEFARLTGSSIKDIQSDREGAAVTAAAKWRQGVGELVCVLKGAGTVVTDGQGVYVNTTGNPGMASGGSGDVLTGLVAAFAGQGLSAFDAAQLAVYVHGLAGDLAAEALGQPSLIATDLLDFLPRAIRDAHEQAGGD